MYDIHCHILPNLDDGAQSEQDALRMASIAAKNGTTQIICTPHCTSNDPELDRRLQLILERTMQFHAILSDYELPVQLHPGMELLCVSPLENMLRSGRFLTLAGSRYILLEFPFDTEYYAIEDAAASVVHAGLCPVLAHPERYDCVQHHPERLYQWLDAGWLIQVNRGSITGSLGEESQLAAHWLLSRRMVHLVASDAHRSIFRTPDLRTGYDWIVRHCSEDYASLVLEINPRRILNDRFIPNPTV